MLGKTNSSIGQMWVSVSGLLGWAPQAPQTETERWQTSVGSQLSLLFTLAVKYLFICAANKTKRAPGASFAFKHFHCC